MNLSMFQYNKTLKLALSFAGRCIACPPIKRGATRNVGTIGTVTLAEYLQVFAQDIQARGLQAEAVQIRKMIEKEMTSTSSMHDNVPRFACTYFFKKG